MDAFIVLAFVVGALFVSSLFLPWINRSRINDLREEVEGLKRQLRAVLALLEKEEVKLPPQTTMQEVAPAVQEPERHSDVPVIEKKKEAVKKERLSFEQQFGARLPVWIGGVALALAGFFLVKYSIESGLLSPTVRVVLGVIFGAGLLYTAHWMRSKTAFSQDPRIAQALAGAGIADLYVCIFAATNLYDILPAFIGFAGLAMVTALAVVLSLRYGMPIALLGLVGGFLTPAMVSSQNPQGPLLFIYLYFVLTGLMVVIRRQRWWVLSLPTVLAALLWVCAWVFGGHFTPGDSLYLGLFLLAISATVVITSRQHYEQESVHVHDLFTMTSILNYLTMSGALLLIAVIASRAGFGVMEWGLFGLLSLAGIGLAFFNQKLYGLVPWLSMAVNLVMLVVWRAPDSSLFALTISLFAALYIISGYVLQSRSPRPLIWAGLTAASSIGYYVIGYYELRHTELVASLPLLWGMLAFVFAGLGIYALQHIMKTIPHDHPQKQPIMAVYASIATAFLSIALTIELPREFLSVAFAVQLCAIAWINTKVDVKALRYIAGVLACIFGFLLLPQLLLLAQLAVYSMIEARLALQKTVPIVNWPAFQLGLPAVLFAVSSYFLRRQKDDRLVQALEMAAIALLGVMGYYLTRHAFHVDENVVFQKMSFIERGVITNVLFIYGLLCLWIGRHYARRAVTVSGMALSAIAIFRIVYFDFVLYNPLWSAQAVGDLPILNGLLLSYGLPILWTCRAAQEWISAGKPQWGKYAYGFALLLAFTLLSFLVRQIFHGTYLNGHERINAEIYTYSAIWLLFGIALLFFGTFKKDKMIRVASLVIMILTVGKVFLYDASELEGLLRVLSFFGLGLSLLSLSWFYTRFVFGTVEMPAEMRNR